MADIHFHCRVCDHGLVIEDSAAGFEFRCPECGAAQAVPTSETRAADTVEPQAAVPEFASRETPGGEEFKYTAFISYRHTEPDRQWAEWLHTALETYRVPKKQARERGLPPRLGKLFRDEDELPASADLSREIDRALQQSRFLIVICSPRTPSSEWVNAEVARFRELGRHDQILALLIEGEPRQSFPRALREIRQTIAEPSGGGVEQLIEEIEPLAADVRPFRKEGRRAIKRIAKLRLLARILNVPFDDLRQRERERRRRNAAMAAIVVVTLALTLGTMAITAWHQRQEANHQRRLAQMQQEEVERQRSLVRLREQETEQQRQLAELREKQEQLARLEVENEKKLAEQKTEAARLAEQEAEKQRTLAELSKTAEQRATQIAQQERQKAELTERAFQLLEGQTTTERPALTFFSAARLGNYDKMLQSYAQMRKHFAEEPLLSRPLTMPMPATTIYVLWEERVRDLRSILSTSKDPRAKEVLQVMQEIDRLASQPVKGSRPNAK